MTDLGPHALYIVLAYVGVAAVTSLLVIAVLFNARARKKRLDALEAEARK